MNEQNTKSDEELDLSKLLNRVITVPVLVMPRPEGAREDDLAEMRKNNRPFLIRP